MSIAEAYRRVRRTGCVHGTTEEVMAWLADISDYLGTTDPTELGAALLLEQASFCGTRVQLQLDLEEQGGGPRAAGPAGAGPGDLRRPESDPCRHSACRAEGKERDVRHG